MTASPSGRIRIGCSGWNYPSWRGGAFYPRGLPASRWLAFYAERFDTVEVNATFYRLPHRDAVARWADDTPRAFTFAVKVSRYLTHIKRLRDTAVYIERFLERIEPLADAAKLGPLLWQLPPTFQRDDERLAAALSDLPPVCDTRSSSATRAGSPIGCGSCSGSTTWRSSSPTDPMSARSRPAS